MNERDVPEYHTREILEDGTIFYTVVCAYCNNEIQYKHMEKPDVCPHCGSANYRKPKTETLLFSLQREYKENNSEQALSEMYLILKDYAKSMIKKRLPKEFTYHFDKVEERAIDATNLLMEQYLYKPDFQINSSFGGYLKCKIREVLWNKKLRREENHDSLDVYVEEEDNTVSLLDLSDSVGIHPLIGERSEGSSLMSEVEEEVVFNDELRKKELEEGLQKLIGKILLEIQHNHSILLKLLVLGAIVVRIERGTDPSPIHSFYKLFGPRVKDYLEKVELLIYRFIMEWD